MALLPDEGDDEVRGERQDGTYQQSVEHPATPIPLLDPLQVVIEAL
jgi:hypothetical protein